MHLYPNQSMICRKCHKSKMHFIYQAFQLSNRTLERLDGFSPPLWADWRPWLAMAGQYSGSIFHHIARLEKTSLFYWVHLLFTAYSFCITTVSENYEVRACLIKGTELFFYALTMCPSLLNSIIHSRLFLYIL